MDTALVSPTAATAATDAPASFLPVPPSESSELTFCSRCAGYLRPVLSPTLRKADIENTLAALRGVDFQAIVVTGVSGVSYGSVIAHLLGKALIIVRKTSEGTHSQRLVEGPDPEGLKTWVFLDDLVGSGATAHRVVAAMRSEYPETRCVGHRMYHRHRSGNFLGVIGKALLSPSE